MMKKFLLLLLFIMPLVVNANESTDKLQEKHLKEQMEKEKKYAKEQKFYMGEDYDLKSFQVDENSLKNIPEQENHNEDFDMDSVYD